MSDMADEPVEKLKSPVESLDQLNTETAPELSTQNHKRDVSDDDDLLYEDGSFFDGVTKEDLDKEWSRRHNHFYTIGYREGLIAGKESSAQEGFNDGFKESVLVGFNWGLLRGVTSMVAFLPDDLKEKLVGNIEVRKNFENLYESVQSISSKEALKLFHDDLISSRAKELQSNENPHVEVMRGNTSYRNQLEKLSRELQCLLHESPPIEVHSAVDRLKVE